MSDPLSFLARKMLADRIIKEVRKQIREKASSAFLASVLPPPDGCGEKADLLVRAALFLRIETLELDCTLHLGSDTREVLSVPPEDLPFELETACPLRRPDDVSSSGPLKLGLDRLALSCSLDGIGFRKMMIGMGATVHSVRLEAVLSGEGTGQWRGSAQQPEQKV